MSTPLSSKRNRSTPDNSPDFQQIASVTPLQKRHRTLSEGSPTLQEIKDPFTPSTMSLTAQLIEALKAPEVRSMLRETMAESLDVKLQPIHDKLNLCEESTQRQAKTVAELNRKVQEKNNELDELRQYTRRNNMRIFGIPESMPENTDSLVLNLAKKLHIEVSVNDIQRSHRSGDPAVYEDTPRPILVQFVSYRMKREFLAHRRKLKDIKEKGEKNIYFNEDLTKHRSRMAAEVRRMYQENTITNTWVSDGIIFVKTKEDKLLRITRRTQLDELISSIEEASALLSQDSHSTQTMTGSESDGNEMK